MKKTEAIARLPIYTPNRIHNLRPEQIFVFGSNTQGRHGMGAALAAMKFGAVYGQPRGRQGQTYAIATKDLAIGRRSLPLQSIWAEIDLFIDYAEAHPELEFLVTELGCGLAGYFPAEMVKPFRDRFGQGLEDLPNNIILPKSFYDAS